MNLKTSTKMLPLSSSIVDTCHLWITLFLLVVYAKVVIATTRVSLSAPVNPVKEGGMMALHCLVSEPSDDQSVTIYRWIDGKSETISWQDDILNSVDDRAYLATRILGDGSAVYFLSITEVTRADEGRYSCEVLQRTDRGLGTVSEDSIPVQVRYYPANPSPECASNYAPHSKIVSGTELAMNCSSEQGFPTVSLTWKRAGTRGESITRNAVQHQVNSQGMLISEMHIRVSLKDKDAVFLCQMKSDAFPDSVESCHIGPLVVIPNPNEPSVLLPDNNDNDVYRGEPDYPLLEDDVNNKRPDTDLYSDTDADDEQDKLRCKSVCSEATTTTSIWRIATVIASAIAIVFLLIAIAIYIRIHHEATSNRQMEIRRRSQQMQLHYATTAARGQPLDCVYEELKYRHDSDGNKVYMALVRPRKPDSLAVPVVRNVTDVEGNYTLTPTTINNNTCPQHQL